jgi:hypothetical protein
LQRNAARDDEPRRMIAGDKRHSYFASTSDAIGNTPLIR